MHIHGRAMVDFYSVLLGTPFPNRQSVDYNIIQAGALLSSEDAMVLCRDISNEEIGAALQGIGNDKAPGMDGFNSFFFKKNWDIVGNDVSSAIHYFFRTNRLAKQFSATALTIIPKCNNPNGLTDYRPIACCSIVYKIITKIITARLEAVLGKLISPLQSAFIKGRNFFDNILVAHELVRGYHKVSDEMLCACKIDIKKAYDSVAWDFLEEMLLGLGFPSRFIGWIMSCVRNASYSLMINGCLEGSFQGKKGLRQGDPLSPLLFVIVMEYLSRSLADPPAYFKYHRGCEEMKLTHLCFADDLFMFCGGDKESVGWLKEKLHQFHRISGLQVNDQKSCVYISAGLAEKREELIGASEFQAGTLPVRYLGIPLVSSRLRKEHCSDLVDKITTKIQGWAVKFFSYAGRLMLIRSVLRSIHVYWCSVLLLPKAIIKVIDAKCRNYLWSEGIHAVDWKEVCLPKKEGGLGINELESWNKAAVGKQI
jgi:hypothetical protein